MEDAPQPRPVEVLVVGAGDRGNTYATFALDSPDRMRVVGVAEPNDVRRISMANKYNISDDLIFKSWTEVILKPKCADVVIIATQDQLHAEPAIAFAKLGYNILLEKPMAVTESDCKDITETCKENNIVLTVCHELRYHPLNRMMKDLIDQGLIGDVTHIQQTECVGFWHFAHSFVRGNWSMEKGSTFFLMAKNCHDIDLIKYWMGDNRCVKVSSFGSLQHFTKDNKPSEASSRCIDCPVESQCAYSAFNIYVNKLKRVGVTGWPVNVVCDNPDIESLTAALATSPYGRCVYDCDNDVCTNQVVNMEFEGGRTAALTSIAFTDSTSTRSTHIYGTKGQLRCDGVSMEHFDFLTQSKNIHYSPELPKTSLKAHSGADYYLMDSFISAVQGGTGDVETNGADTLASHMLVFAAEHARKNNVIVTVHEDNSYSCN